MTNEHIENAKETVNFLLSMAVGIAPLIGVAAAYKQSSPFNLSVNNPLPNKTSHAVLGNAIGAAAREEKKLEARRNKVIEKQVRKELNKSTDLVNLLKEPQERAALLQAFAVTLDDPSLDIPDATRSQLKQQLQAMTVAGTVPDEEAVVRDIAKMLETAQKPDALRVFRQSLKDFRKISNQLAPSVQVGKYGVSYSVLPFNQLNPVNQSRLQRLQDTLGRDYMVEAYGYKENVPGMGQSDFLTARIYKYSGANKKFLSSIPLDMPGNLYRSGESGMTLYGVLGQMMDVRAAHGYKKSNNPSLLELRQAGILRATPDVFIDELGRRIRREGGFSHSAFNEWMRAFMVNVDRPASTGHAMAPHIIRQMQIKMNAIGLYNIEAIPQKEQAQAVASIGGWSVMDPGVGGKRLLERSQLGMMGTMGFHQGSLFERLQQIYGWDTPTGNSVSRTIVPLTLREQQLIGRASRLSTPGSSMDQVYHPLQTHMTGATHRPFVIDFTKKGVGRLSSLEKSGYAFTGRGFEIEKPLQYTILDPRKHGLPYQGSVIERLLQNPDGITLTADELRQGVYLGEQAGGERKFLPFTESTKEMHVKIDYSGSSSIGGATKHMISISGVPKKSMSIVKGFSFLHKGLVEAIDSVDDLLEPERMNLVSNAFTDANVDLNLGVFTSSDMLAKGAIGQIEYMSGAVRFFNKALTTDRIRNEAHQIASLSNYDAVTKELIDTAVTDQGRDHRKVAYLAKAILNFAKNGELVKPEHLGIALTGVFHGAQGESIKGFGLKQDALIQLVENVYSDPADKAAAVRAMKLGIGVSSTLMQPGEGPDDWGRARGSVEPRFAKTLHERLMHWGMPMNDASKIVANVYRSKIGFSRHFELSSHMMDVLRSIHGQQGFLDPLTEPTRLTYKQLNEQMIQLQAKNTQADITDLLASKKGGYTLSFEDAPELLRNAARDVFGKEEIHLVGKEAFDVARGTIIKNEKGSAVEIEPGLGQLYKSLYGRIQGFALDSKQTRESLSIWKEEADRLAVGIISQLTSGQLKGTSAPVVGAYFLTTGIGMANKQQLSVGRTLAARSRYSASFLNTEGFVSQLLDQKSQTPASELAWRAEQYFTGLERIVDTNVPKDTHGLVSIGSRHPQMTSGSVFYKQTYRHLNEVTALGGKDVFYEQMAKTDKGAELLEKHFGAHWKTMRGFQDVAVHNEKTTKAFFQDFIKNLQHFSSGGNAGVEFYPSMEIEGKEIGMGYRAFQDYDGDHVQNFMLRRADAQKLLKHIAGTDADHFLLTELQSRQFIHTLKAQTKGALNQLAKTLPAAAQPEVEDALKEIGLSMKTGIVDVQLRRIHDAMQVFHKDATEVSRHRDFLGALQELFVIKTKSLPVYTDYPEEISRAARVLMDTGEVGELRAVLNEIYKGQDIATSQGVETKFPTKIDTPDPEFNHMYNRLAGQYAQNNSFMYSLESFIGTAEKVAKQAMEVRNNMGMTEDAMYAQLANNPEEFLDRLNTGNSIIGGSMEGFRGHPDAGAALGFAKQQMIDASGKLSSNLIGKMAIATLAGVAGMSMFTGTHSAKPLFSEGEFRNQSVVNAIAENRLFGGNDPNVPVDQFTQTPPPPIIGMGQTYMNRPNAYQIRGTVDSGNSLDAFRSYYRVLTGTSGKGLISINDHRMPITSSYLDRLTGEY